MSEKNREGKRTARERMAVERQKQQTAEKRRRVLIVGGSVVCVLALATAVGVLAAKAGKSQKSGASGPAIVPSGATGKDGVAIPVGKDSAKSTLAVWEDFRCPACQAFETVYRPTIHQLVDAGKLRVEYHLVTLIDGNLGGSGSRTAANAVACAQDAGGFRDYHDVLYDNQPKETQDAYADNTRLIDLAGKVRGLDSPAFQKCLKNGTHDSWVVKSNAAFQKARFTGTPTVLLGGRNLVEDRTMTPAKLKQMVDAANKP